jgi:chromosome segregation ATPase
MPALSDIAFECPNCNGPLMAQVAHAGLACECPHCYVQLEVPEGNEVNKDSFVEPPGLRRVLKQVRDREMEIIRRKFIGSKARVAELEAELHRAQSALAAEEAIPKFSADNGAELESLRKQLAEISDKFTAANQAFMAGRKQQDTVIEHLRRELEHARGEAQTFKKKNEDLARQLQVSLQKLENARASVSQEEVDRLQTELAELRSNLEAESAKVLLMEAAAIGVDGDAEGPQVKNEVLVRELQAQVADLRKDNASVRAARDKAHAEITQLRDQLSQGEDLGSLETSLAGLQNELADTLKLIVSRKRAKAASPRKTKA